MGTNYVTWDSASTHEDDEFETVVHGAAGRLVLLYLPTYSPWLNPVERLWRQFRREVTHCELFEAVKALLTASREFFTVVTKTRTKCFPLSGFIHHNFFAVLRGSFGSQE